MVWEVEFGVVIGKGGAYIDEANAMDYVAGFCVVNVCPSVNFRSNGQALGTKGKGAIPWVQLAHGL